VYAVLIAALLLVGCSEGGSSGEGAGGQGASGGGGSGGAPACAEPSTSACEFQGPDGGCPDGQVCTIEPTAGCGDAACCTLGYVCAAPVGRVPGGGACDSDDACASGSCLTVGGRGVCLRACRPGFGDDSCPEGQLCALLSLDGRRSVRACVGDDEGGGYDAARTLCRHDGECAAGRICKVMRGERFYQAEAYGLCEPGARGDEFGKLCVDAGGGPGDPGSARCAESGLCLSPCLDTDATACQCPTGLEGEGCRGFTCTRPCASDAECPSPYLCRFIEQKRLSAPATDLEFKVCTLVPDSAWDWVCWDDGECCVGGVDRFGARCCGEEESGGCDVDPPDRTVCRVTTTAEGRWSAQCALPEARGLPGEPCAAHEACASGLCAPDGRCTSPCLPPEDGRCDALVPGTQCCPMAVDEACLPVCRSDCAEGPTCEG